MDHILGESGHIFADKESNDYRIFTDFHQCVCGGDASNWNYMVCHVVDLFRWIVISC